MADADFKNKLRNNRHDGGKRGVGIFFKGDLSPVRVT